MEQVTETTGRETVYVKNCYDLFAYSEGQPAKIIRLIKKNSTAEESAVESVGIVSIVIIVSLSTNAHFTIFLPLTT